MKPCTLPVVYKCIPHAPSVTYYTDDARSDPEAIPGRFIDEALISRIIKHLEEAEDGNEMLGLPIGNSFIIEARSILEALTK